jgi:hypothetical protein
MWPDRVPSRRVPSSMGRLGPAILGMSTYLRRASQEAPRTRPSRRWRVKLSWPSRPKADHGTHGPQPSLLARFGPPFFVAAATLAAGTIMTAYILDPFDSGRSTVFAKPGVRPQGPRTAAASRGRDQAFDGAMVQPAGANAPTGSGVFVNPLRHLLRFVSWNHLQARR